MRIGIDFDNTIAVYDNVFVEVACEQGLISKRWQGKKGALSKKLRSLPDGEKIWMGLQGQVYGKYMHRAVLAPGVANFLMRCLSNEIYVFVVSHKTEYGHYDCDRIPLRSEALEWMHHRGFFDPQRFGIPRENIYFESTRTEKVERIAALSCTHFIDDLEEVFLEIAFPSDARKILYRDPERMTEAREFSVCKTWSDISRLIFGEETIGDVTSWIKSMIDDEVRSVNLVSKGGNSLVHKVVTQESESYALKQYPDQGFDPRPRLETEFQAFELLHQYRITNVPRSVDKDEDSNLGLYEWIEGESVIDPTREDLHQAISFVADLHLVSREMCDHAIRLASGACLSWVDLIGQVEERLSRLRAVRPIFTELSYFLDHSFEPLWEEVKDKSYHLWPAQSRENPLPRELQTLSSSDFGFHNSIRSANGRLIFIDFDYFGWDDPVKLAADFVWHPAMNLQFGIVSKWRKAMSNLFSDDGDFHDRLSAAMPLYGMCWVMICMNEFLPGFSQSRRNASRSVDYHHKRCQHNQLIKGKQYCNRVKTLSSQPEYA